MIRSLLLRLQLKKLHNECLWVGFVFEFLQTLLDDIIRKTHFFGCVHQSQILFVRKGAFGLYGIKRLQGVVEHLEVTLEQLLERLVILEVDIDYSWLLLELFLRVNH